MADREQQTRSMTRYLLAQMSEEERADFEKQYLANEELFAELVATETETIRSYLEGAGSEADRKEFERRFLTTPSRRGHVEFENTLVEYLSRNAPSQMAAHQMSKAPGQAGSDAPYWRLAAVAAMLLVLVGGPWLMVVNRRLSREIEQLRLDESQSRQQEQQLHRQLADLNAQLDQQRKVTSDQQQLIAQLQSPAVPVAPFTLSPGQIRRVDRQKTLVIKHDLSAVPLELRLPQNEYSRYSVSLETPEGDRIWQQQNLATRKSANGRRVLALRVPSNLLQNRTYILMVSGMAPDQTTEKVASYTFRIQKQ
jgi:hypothetical protein